MKPIFLEEKIFLEEELNIKLPDYCWKDGSKIYLNCKDDKPIIVFKVINGQLYLRKNIIKTIEDTIINVEYTIKNKVIKEQWINKTWEEEYQEIKPCIDALLEESIDETVKCIKRYPDHGIRKSNSGGKDSQLEELIVDEALQRLNKNPEDYCIDFCNSTNESPETYKRINNEKKSKKVIIHNPEKGMIRWLKEDKNYYLPTLFVRNCCSTYKENRINQDLDKNKNYLIFLGMRKNESNKRANYDWYLNDAIIKQGQRLNVPANWIRFLPAVNWKDEDVWLFIIHSKQDFNYMYRLGFNRVGCLICPNQDDYTDILIKKYYPFLWKRWEEVLEKNYEMYDIQKRLKWTLEEWKNGKWKLGISKELELIHLKPTNERVKKLAEIKGIPEALARKYFQKKCTCNKTLNPDEIAMFLKLNGRYENVDDSRQYLCKKCLCKEKGISEAEYKQLVIGFRNQGCNLF